MAATDAAWPVPPLTTFRPTHPLQIMIFGNTRITIVNGATKQLMNAFCITVHVHFTRFNVRAYMQYVLGKWHWLLAVSAAGLFVGAA